MKKDKRYDLAHAYENKDMVVVPRTAEGAAFSIYYER